MAACCTTCSGKGYTLEATDRGTNLIDRCHSCGGSGGWNEIDGNVTGGWGAHFVAAAERRRESQQ